MVVKISKPAINLREKISQLDYDALPYDKIPIGSVVQTVVNYPQASNAMEGTNRARQDVAVRAHQPGTSDVFAEVTGADYRTTISPKFYSSMLLLDLTFLFGGNNNGSISGFKFMQSRMQDMSNPFDLVNNAPYSGGGSRQFTHGSSRQADSDGNDRHTMHISAMVPAYGTESRTYGLWHYSEANHTKYFNATTTANSGCSFSPWRFVIQEIRQ